METPIIYLASVAGSTRPLLKALGCADSEQLINLVRSAVGDGYTVEGDARLIEADEGDDRGGRTDDGARAEAIQSRLADDRTVAFVTLRGGAWLTRILDRIDFTVLAHRHQRIALFGFSELTTLLNIAAAYPSAFALYDLGPGFIRHGLRQFARRNPGTIAEEEADRSFPDEFAVFFRDVVAVLEGRGSRRSITGELVSGTLSRQSVARFVGGNLAVLTTLPGTRFARSIETAARWLVFEDINESPERIDRRLAHLKLAGAFKHCAGVLVGDFHEGDVDHQPAVVELLKYHLPPERDIPVITTRDVGHIWPLAPLPLNSMVSLNRDADPEQGTRVRFDVHWPAIVQGGTAPRIQ